MKYYYVLQTKTVKVKNKVVDEYTSLLGYNMNEMEKDNVFNSFEGSTGHKSSSKIVHNEDEETITKNSFGGHDTRYKSGREAYKELIVKPKEFNEALSVIKKYGFNVVPRHQAHVVSYQQAVGL